MSHIFRKTTYLHPLLWGRRKQPRPVDDGSVTVPVTGVTATGQVGSVTVTADANVAVTGVSGTGQVGTVTTGISCTVPVSGVSGSSAA